jgi:hypothetical protein
VRWNHKTAHEFSQKAHLTAAGDVWLKAKADMTRATAQTLRCFRADIIFQKVLGEPGLISSLFDTPDSVVCAIFSADTHARLCVRILL